MTEREREGETPASPLVRPPPEGGDWRLEPGSLSIITCVLCQVHHHMDPDSIIWESEAPEHCSTTHGVPSPHAPVVLAYRSGNRTQALMCDRACTLPINYLPIGKVFTNVSIHGVWHQSKGPWGGGGGGRADREKTLGGLLHNEIVCICQWLHCKASTPSIKKAVHYFMLELITVLCMCRREITFVECHFISLSPYNVLWVRYHHCISLMWISGACMASQW